MKSIRAPAPATPTNRQRPGLRLRGAIAGLLALCLVAASAFAGDKGDHDRARAAVESGAALPLPVLLDRLGRSHPGQVLELELEQDDGRWIYEVKLLQADGSLLKLDLDARSGQVLKLKRKDKTKGSTEAVR